MIKYKLKCTYHEYGIENRIKDESEAIRMDYMHKLDEMRKYTSTWNSDRHPGSTMSASPLATKLFSSELFGTFSGANTTKFVVLKGFNVLLLIGIMITPGGYS